MADPTGKGVMTRRAVLGNAHVDSAEDASTSFDGPFQDLLNGAVWADVWARPGLAKRDRSLITLALLAAQGDMEEFVLHVRATARTGASRDEIMEALLHVAIYSGTAKASQAFNMARRTLAEMDVERAASHDGRWD